MNGVNDRTGIQSLNEMKGIDMVTQSLFFYIFAALLIGSSLMVVVSRNPVRAALFLVFSFVMAAPLWMIAEAEFLSLVLIFVYVGAVMTLFLFVVMMLNLDDAPKREGFVRYLPFGCIVIALMVGIMIYVVEPAHLTANLLQTPVSHGVNYSNVKELGGVLYTLHVYPFEIAAILLLAAIVASISLVFRGSQKRKGQVPGKQVKVSSSDRLKIVKMATEKSE